MEGRKKKKEARRDTAMTLSNEDGTSKKGAGNERKKKKGKKRKEKRNEREKADGDEDARQATTNHEECK